MNYRNECAQIFPVDYRNALQAAAAQRDYNRIDRLTDEMAHQGLVRRRDDGTMFESIAAKEPIPSSAGESCG